MTEQRATSDGRSAMWAIIGVLVGAFLPIFLCVCLIATTVVGLGASLGSAAPSPEIVAGAGPIRARHLSGPLTGPAVAVISVNGPIVSGEVSDFDLVGTTVVAASAEIARLIKAAAENSDVKAILLKVDSPGGSVIGSDEIYQALKKAGKPVVVQMGAIAASGGYYVSMAADHIVAHPDTLTGSIGVISEFTNIEGLYEKLGLKSTIIKSGEFKDFGNPTSPFTEEDRALWQAVIDEVYEHFVMLVANGRKMTVEEVKKLADGRIYTGRQALKLKLVDQLGYFEDAVDKAAALGGISGEPRVIEYRRETPFAQLFGLSVARAILVALGLPVERLNTRPAVLEYR
jgi:protease-4